MAPRIRGKQAVYIGVLPDGFKPVSFWSVPPGFLSVELYSKNLPMYQATGFARTFNKRQLQDRLPGRKWAFVARHLKSSRHGQHPDARQAREGGAA
jgi:hypothetical protein